MALRGWRLFGVAGTIFAYVAGILLLSIVSLNNPNQRRPRSGRFGEVCNKFLRIVRSIGLFIYKFPSTRIAKKEFGVVYILHMKSPV